MHVCVQIEMEKVREEMQDLLYMGCREGQGGAGSFWFLQFLKFHYK